MSRPVTFCVFAALGIFAFVPGSTTAVMAQAAPYGCNRHYDPIPVRNTEPTNLEVVKRDLLNYRCKHYDADIAAVLREAQEWVRKRAPEIVAAGKKPAIVLDIDETSLANWPRIFKDDYGFVSSGACDLKSDLGVPCGDLAWQANGQAPAIGPTLDLYNLAQCSNVPAPCTRVEVFFNTGRHEKNNSEPIKDANGKEITPREWTIANLTTAKYAGVPSDHLYMRGDALDGGVAKYKTSKRIAIEDLGFTIIANVGDQDSDLAGEHADRTFKVPNPFYYIQ